MNLHEQIKEYIATQPEPQRSDMQELHDHTDAHRILIPLDFWLARNPVSVANPPFPPQAGNAKR